MTHKEWARGHSLSEDKWNHLLRAPLTLLEKDGAEQSSSELPPQPNSYASTQTSISDGLKTNLLHELPSPAASWKRPCEQIASLKYEVKKNNTILSSSSDSGARTFKVQSSIWAAVFCKAFFKIFFFIPIQSESFTAAHWLWLDRTCSSHPNSSFLSFKQIDSIMNHKT